MDTSKKNIKYNNLTLRYNKHKQENTKEENIINLILSTLLGCGPA